MPAVQVFIGQGTPTACPDHRHTHALAYTTIPITQFPDQMRGQKAIFSSPDTEGQVVPYVHFKRALKVPATPL